MREVEAPDGHAHTVRIDWLGNRLRRAPRSVRQRVSAGRRRATSTVKHGGDAAAEAASFDLEAFAMVAVAVAVVALLFLVGFPLLAGLLEILAVLVAGALIWSFRILFRRPWRVIHLADGEEVDHVVVVGWRRAHRVMVEAADEVARSGSAALTFSAASSSPTAT